MTVPAGLYASTWTAGPLRGSVRLRILWDVIDKNSHVLASICELGDLASEERQANYSGPWPFVGDARMTVHNIAPGPGQATIRVSVDWPSPLPIYLHVVVINGWRVQ